MDFCASFFFLFLLYAKIVIWFSLFYARFSFSYIIIIYNNNYYFKKHTKIMCLFLANLSATAFLCDFVSVFVRRTAWFSAALFVCLVFATALPKLHRFRHFYIPLLENKLKLGGRRRCRRRIQLLDNPLSRIPPLRPWNGFRFDRRCCRFFFHLFGSMLFV